MMGFKGYYFNIFMMYEVPFKNALFNKTVIAQVRPKFVSGGVWATLGLWEQGNWKAALRHKWGVGVTVIHDNFLESASIIIENYRPMNPKMDGSLENEG